MSFATTDRDLGRALAAVRDALPAITGLQLAETGRVVGKYYGAYISTTFQPWRNPAHGAIIAYEAYARSHSKNGGDLSPWQLFADAAVDSDLVTLDRLCRTVHTLNYFSGRDITQPLVLNVDARLLQAVPERHGEFFGKVLSLLGVSPTRIVIEIHTSHLLDLTRLKQILASYRRHGFAVAIDAESVIHARSLAHLLVPDLLMIYASAFSPDALARQVASLHEAGVRVAVKHVETAETYAAAVAGGVDWIQGFHLDRPATELPDFSSAKP
jgi:EAL domain-containing protein (putative c-di-GMP-specific phosphodiesterase class I)